MDLHEAIFGTMSGVGLLALSIGAFGVLDAFNKRNTAAKRVDWLIALYAVGVTLNIVAYTFLEKWYIASTLRRRTTRAWPWPGSAGWPATGGSSARPGGPGRPG